MSPKVDVALEVGNKRTFATALEWPGWSRAGRDGDAALEALLAYAPRYATVVRSAVRGFSAPRSLTAFEVVERTPGDATTDFGAPGTPPGADGQPATARDLRRLEAILRACWTAFDAAVSSVEGLELRTGARGGGRDLAKIRAHVLDADRAYLSKLGGTSGRGATHEEIREEYVEALGARARGELPDVGPRGGARWSPRYAVRRAAWHALDHAWELEDRT